MKKQIMVMLLSVAGLYGMNENKNNRWCWSRSDERADMALKEKDRSWLLKLMASDFPLRGINNRRENLLHIGMRLLVETNSEIVRDNVIYLLQEGCDHQAQDVNGDTPWEAAHKRACLKRIDTQLFDLLEQLFKAGGIIVRQ